LLRKIERKKHIYLASCALKGCQKYGKQSIKLLKGKSAQRQNLGKLLKQFQGNQVTHKGLQKDYLHESAKETLAISWLIMRNKTAKI
jgi:hypothetical protein